MKQKILRFIPMILSVIIFGFVLVYICSWFLFAYLILSNYSRWVIVVYGALIIIFPWELLTHTRMFRRITTIIARAKNQLALSKFTFNGLKSNFSRLIVWYTIYAAILFAVTKYTQYWNDRGRLIDPLLPWVLGGAALSTFIFLSFCAVLRVTTFQIPGHSIFDKKLRNSFSRNYPSSVIFGTLTILSLVLIMLTNIALGRQYNYVRVKSKTADSLGTLRITLNEINLSNSTVIASASVSSGYFDSIVITNNGYQTVYASIPIEKINEQYVFQIRGDTYYYPFSKYKLYIFYDVPYLIPGVSSTANSLTMELIEESRIFDLSRNQGEDNSVVLSLSPYYKLLVITTFLTLGILLLIIWSTKDRNTFFQLIIGVFAALLTMRGFLIPWDLRQPLFIDQMLLVYIVILIITLLLKLTRKVKND